MQAPHYAKPQRPHFAEHHVSICMYFRLPHGCRMWSCQRAAAPGIAGPGLSGQLGSGIWWEHTCFALLGATVRRMVWKRCRMNVTRAVTADRAFMKMISRLAVFCLLLSSSCSSGCCCRQDRSGAAAGASSPAHQRMANEKCAVLPVCNGVDTLTPPQSCKSRQLKVVDVITLYKARGVSMHPKLYRPLELSTMTFH